MLQKSWRRGLERKGRSGIRWKGCANKDMRIKDRTKKMPHIETSRERSLEIITPKRD